MKRTLRFIYNNVMKGKIPNRPGMYKFFDNKGGLLYVGHSKKLRHRIQSYYQKDVFSEHPTKKTLRNKIHTFTYETMPRLAAQAKEKRLKQKTRYNKL